MPGKGIGQGVPGGLTANALPGMGVVGPRLGLPSGVHAPDIGVQDPEDGAQESVSGSAM